MRENGYYLPHVAVGYPVIVAVGLGVWPVMRYVFGVQSDAVILTTMIVVGLLFGVWFIRYAKMLWLVIDLAMHPKVVEDFQARGRRGNAKSD
jgi:hypothetical protein